ncbi:hypothetical protein [Paenibacillus cremeus]|uniref:MYXO-CTERM domain-containing protein n=1 Tax=Paenibacillus cremeus TaxID=2163881 RepID=A0A559KGV1_9BACL|nr:hypothetical protein [Paenibacillus cremeus]TVY11360.1 hypothetical protein FPZ49_03790 [Paenibacillus cremeus]
MVKKLTILLILGLVCCPIFLSKLTAETTFQPHDSSGGPYGRAGFSGSGYTGNGYYPSLNSVRSYEIYDPTITSAHILSSTDNKVQRNWEWLGFVGLLGCLGILYRRKA